MGIKCEAKDCQRERVAKKYCLMHYKRFRNHGTTDLLVEQHGMKGTPTYATWSNMKTRCYNKNNYHYPRWGGRGITICNRWKDSFNAFFEDMKEKPENRTIDRIDNEGGYWCGKCQECIENGWPFNCRWATIAEQNENKNHRLSKSGYRGVYRVGKYGFVAYKIAKKAKREYLGFFKSAEEANNARLRALNETS